MKEAEDEVKKIENEIESEIETDDEAKINQEKKEAILV
jgi:hypothetical protein